MLDLWADSFIATAAEITERRFVFEARDDASQRQHTSLIHWHIAYIENINDFKGDRSDGSKKNSKESVFVQKLCSTIIKCGNFRFNNVQIDIE